MRAIPRRSATEGDDSRADGLLEVDLEGEIWYWRGPSPYHFVTVPAEPSAAIRALASTVTFGWGMIPIRVRLGESEWTTAMFPKDGAYVVPIKDAVRRSEGLAAGDVVTMVLTVRR
jgi:hypothetical protein